VDTSTDLRKQAIRERIPRIDAVLFTHAHADHIHGIDDLRGFHFLHREVIPCYGSRQTLAEIDSKFSYIFTGLPSSGYHKLMEPNTIDGPFELFGLTITPIPLLHGEMPATGFRFGPAAYLSDCSNIPESSLKLLSGLGILIIDGLRYTPHPHHYNIPGAISVAGELKPERTILTHMTHEVSHAREAELPEKVCFAYDGMTIEL
jgi:phosphoribosyl 1,2-cyclic phosphate phosphodiesterase